MILAHIQQKPTNRVFNTRVSQVELLKYFSTTFEFIEMHLYSVIIYPTSCHSLSLCPLWNNKCIVKMSKFIFSIQWKCTLIIACQVQMQSSLVYLKKKKKRLGFERMSQCTLIKTCTTKPDPEKEKATKAVTVATKLLICSKLQIFTISVLTLYHFSTNTYTLGTNLYF